MPRDRQLIGKSCCLVLRDQIIEARSSMHEARMEIRFANGEFRLVMGTQLDGIEVLAEMLDYRSYIFERNKK